MGAGGGGTGHAFEPGQGSRFCPLSLRPKTWGGKPMAVATGAPFADTPGRDSPRRARHFSLSPVHTSRQRKVPQRKATRLAASLRCAAGNLRCSRPAGSRSNSRFASAQTVASPCPLAALLLGADRRVAEARKPKPQNQKPETRTANHRTARQANAALNWGHSGTAPAPETATPSRCIAMISRVSFLAPNPSPHRSSTWPSWTSSRNSS